MLWLLPLLFCCHSQRESAVALVVVVALLLSFPRGICCCFGCCCCRCSFVVIPKGNLLLLLRRNPTQASSACVGSRLPQAKPNRKPYPVPHVVCNERAGKHTPLRKPRQNPIPQPQPIRSSTSALACMQQLTAELNGSPDTGRLLIADQTDLRYKPQAIE